MADAKKRIALKPHMKQIREWVDAGKADDWIADALGTSASSVQSFRSRNDIYRRERGGREPESVFEGVLDHGERDGWGLWLDPAVREDSIWSQHWANVDAVIVKVAEDSIVLEIDSRDEAPAQENGVMAALSSNGQTSFDNAPSSENRAVASEDGASFGELSPELIADIPESASTRERGRVKWFDPEKGYGFLVRPNREDLFVHHSEVQGDPAALSPNDEVEYEVGENDRGPNARGVRPVG